MEKINDFLQVGTDADISLDEGFYRGILTCSPDESGYVAYAIGAPAAEDYSGSEWTFGYVDASRDFIAAYGVGADLTTLYATSRHFFIWDYMRGGPALYIDGFGRVGIHLPPYEEPTAFLDVRGTMSCQESLMLPTQDDAQACEGLFFGSEHGGKLCRKKGETVVEIG